jgi:hypothetical protein
MFLTYRRLEGTVEMALLVQPVTHTSNLQKMIETEPSMTAVKVLISTRQ